MVARKLLSAIGWDSECSIRANWYVEPLVAGPTTFVFPPTNMADLNDEDKIEKLKNSEIAVHVEEALNDVIVVSFRHQGRVYQGALLDSTKK
jgi:hypothetical protein